MSETDRDHNIHQHNGSTPLGFSTMAKVTRIYIIKLVLLYILTQRSTIIPPLCVNTSMLIATAATLSPTFASMSLFLYPKLVSLQLKIGVKMGGQYRSDKACRRFIGYIYEDVMTETLLYLQTCTMFGIMFDGATNKSVTEMELVYARLVVDGQVRNMYVCVRPLQDAHAKGIYGVINEAFIDLGVNNWQSKVVGVGCDGAAVNIGRRNSGMTRI